MHATSHAEAEIGILAAVWWQNAHVTGASYVAV